MSVLRGHCLLGACLALAMVRIPCRIVSRRKPRPRPSSAPSSFATVRSCVCRWSMASFRSASFARKGRSARSTSGGPTFSG